MKKIFVDKKNQLILLLCVLFLIKVSKEDARFVFWVLGGVFLTGAADILINRIFLKRKITPKSAIITGFITSGIIDYHQGWFVLVIFSLLAIISKHLIRIKGRHIFNPANFALFIATLFKVPLTWNIETNIYLIIVFGIYIAYSIKKTPLVMGFLISFIALFATQGINPFTLISWFFIFVMLIEPKTSAYGLIRGSIFGVIAGIVAFLVFRFIPEYDLFVSSLFVANTLNIFFGTIKNKK